MSARQSQGKVVAFKPLAEEWNYYSLEDGTILGVKVIVTKIFRLDKSDGTPVLDPSGQPAYQFFSQNVSRVLSPEEYRAMVGVGKE